MNKKTNKNKGITLIALVITIIVMLILVAVTISMAVNGGLFNYAGKASKETQNAIDAEQELSNGKIKVGDKWYASIDDYLKGKYIGYVPTYSEAEFDGEYLAENATYTSGDYTAVIPKGFKIMPGINNTTTIADGLVIQDKEGNEFVWIPVTYTKEGTLDENGYDTGFKKAFYRSDWTSNTATGGERTTLSTDYTEPYTSGYEGEETDYNEMLESVYKNGGFYIARYEAGIKTTESPRTLSTTGTTTGWVVQRNCYPYIYVAWGPSGTSYTGDVTQNDATNRGSGALELCKNFYTDVDKVGVTSTLCYGIMWDAMLDFIKDSSHDVTNSTIWGNYRHNTSTITNTDARWTTSPSSDSTWTPVSSSGKTKDGETRILLTTGASDSFAAKNIYDVAGNVYEWTNEAYSWNGMFSRVCRGGDYNGYGRYGDDHPASIRVVTNPNECSTFTRL